MQAARQSLRFGDSQVPPPTFGVWALLELADCDFVNPNAEATAYGGVMAAYIAATGSAAAPFVNAYAAKDEKPTGLEEAVSQECPLMSRAVVWAESIGATGDDYLALSDWLYCAFAGFQMIPGGEGGGDFVFGLDSYAAMAVTAGEALGVRWDELMWQTPLVVVGHAVAQRAKQEGTKGVARPKDKEHLREMLRTEKQCVAEKRLCPWHEQYPLAYPLEHEVTEDEYYRYAVRQHEEREKLGVG